MFIKLTIDGHVNYINLGIIARGWKNKKTELVPAGLAEQEKHGVTNIQQFTDVFFVVTTNGVVFEITNETEIQQAEAEFEHFYSKFSGDDPAMGRIDYS